MRWEESRDKGGQTPDRHRRGCAVNRLLLEIMREPLDPDECRASWSDPIHDEINRLTGDNRALRMLLKDCKGELMAFKTLIGIHYGPDALVRRNRLVQQIDDELKSE